MTTPPLVPPIKCQGIKTKLVSEIKRLADGPRNGRWIEPFCGSGVVALNVQPRNALLCDSNIHIIRFYKDLQSGVLTPAIVKEFLTSEGSHLRQSGESYYYMVRERFNEKPNSLDFLFLNRSCFNGVMRFNRRGHFNVPFCHKPDRFSQAYITKIANQVRSISKVVALSEWEFRVSDFKDALAEAKENDFIYADPPYAGRHVDYFNTWTENDERDLVALLENASCRFILSTWHSNRFRSNPMIEKNWGSKRFHIFIREHYYHVGATENMRHPMIEALVTNFSVDEAITKEVLSQQKLFVEEPQTRYATV